jgi:hypothetical protein
MADICQEKQDSTPQLSQIDLLKKPLQDCPSQHSVLPTYPGALFHHCLDVL